jgi:hypothetical protein
MTAKIDFLTHNRDAVFDYLEALNRVVTEPLASQAS